jgi:hypothetical protein
VEARPVGFWRRKCGDCNQADSTGTARLDVESLKRRVPAVQKEEQPRQHRGVIMYISARGASTTGDSYSPPVSLMFNRWLWSNLLPPFRTRFYPTTFQSLNSNPKIFLIDLLAGSPLPILFHVLSDWNQLSIHDEEVKGSFSIHFGHGANSTR